MAIVTLRYWAAAKEAAGVAEEKVSALTLAAALAAGLAAVAAREEPTGPRSAGSGSNAAAQGSNAAVPGSADSGRPAGSARPTGERVARLRLVLARSSYLIDGNPVGVRPPESVTLSDAAVIEVLPPFAGG
jgi:molybdopterin converting factor small subunit